MPRDVPRHWPWLCAVLAATSVLFGPQPGRFLFGFSFQPSSATGAGKEVRALWVVRTSLASPSAIASMVTAARAAGFNTLLVQIRGRGDAFYANGLEPRSSLLSSRPDFDPLATTILLGHEAGLQVHAWINVNLVAGIELPQSSAHVVRRHPEWVMVPRALAGDLAALDPHHPEYLARLLRYVRAQPSELEGLYLSPVTDGAIGYTTAVVRDIVTRYEVDGVHLDYVRYPTDEFDYSRVSLSAFRRIVSRELQAIDRRAYDARLPGEPLVLTQAFPDRWRAFRAARLTDLVGALRAAVRTARPSAILSAAVRPDPAEAAAHRLQDWSGWVAHDLIDVVCPMAYTTDGAIFAAQIAAAQEAAGRHPVWAGIGAYRLAPFQIVENIRAARRLGAEGVLLFSYDSLARSEYLGELGRAAFPQ